MTFVYRIQNHFGEGPYSCANGPDTLYHIMRHCYTDARHPTPSEDGLDGFTGHHLFGFKDMKQLEAWFGLSTVYELKKIGFEIHRMEAEPNSIIYGSKQLCFIPKEKDNA